MHRTAYVCNVCGSVRESDPAEEGDMTTYEQIETTDRQVFLLRDPFIGTLAHTKYLVGDYVDENGRSALWQGRTRIVLIDPAAVTGRLPLTLDPDRGLIVQAAR